MSLTIRGEVQAWAPKAGLGYVIVRFDGKPQGFEVTKGMFTGVGLTPGRSVDCCFEEQRGGLVLVSMYGDGVQVQQRRPGHHGVVALWADDDDFGYVAAQGADGLGGTIAIKVHGQDVARFQGSLAVGGEVDFRPDLVGDTWYGRKVTGPGTYSKNDPGSLYTAQVLVASRGAGDVVSAWQKARGVLLGCGRRKADAIPVPVSNHRKMDELTYWAKLIEENPQAHYTVPVQNQEPEARLAVEARIWEQSECKWQVFDFYVTINSDYTVADSKRELRDRKSEMQKKAKLVEGPPPRSPPPSPVELPPRTPPSPIAASDEGEGADYLSTTQGTPPRTQNLFGARPLTPAPKSPEPQQPGSPPPAARLDQRSGGRHVSPPPAPLSEDIEWVCTGCYRAKEMYAGANKMTELQSRCQGCRATKQFIKVPRGTTSRSMPAMPSMPALDALGAGAHAAGGEAAKRERDEQGAFAATDLAKRQQTAPQVPPPSPAAASAAATMVHFDFSSAPAREGGTHQAMPPAAAAAAAPQMMPPAAAAAPGTPAGRRNLKAKQRKGPPQASTPEAVQALLAAFPVGSTGSLQNPGGAGFPGMPTQGGGAWGPSAPPQGGAWGFGAPPQVGGAWPPAKPPQGSGAWPPAQ
eukprot:TRINITY_DN18112_c0_g1_i2.p1 TRINITY_DN18112_c0_g1~~TRINITY_DN18112_c0_g1_i2.p1  ORF type:complete len:635 (+),score=168.51 TRINITY_DN18112_c0_g1_i2:152-2056(+)